MREVERETEWNMREIERETVWNMRERERDTVRDWKTETGEREIEKKDLEQMERTENKATILQRKR
jgi:hypothetical protein